MQTWLEYWNLKGNPFDVTPLSYKDSRFWEYFVENQSVKVMDEYFPTLLTPGRDRSLLILGMRGSGKTTLLNYVLKKIIALKQKNDEKGREVLPIIFSIKDPNAYNSVESLTNSFLDGLLDSMKDAISNSYIDDVELNPYQNQFIDIIESIDDYLSGKKSLNSQQRIYLIKEVSNRIKIFFKRGLLFIDNIDKISESNPDFVERWLIQAQGFIEGVLWENNIYTIFVGPSFWQESFSKSSEFSWFYDTHLYMQQWNFANFVELLSNRLRTFISIPINQNIIERYFSLDALEEIHRLNYGNPRYCLRAAKSCLFHGWESKVELLTLHFVREHPHCINGTFEESELMRNQFLISNILKDKNHIHGYRLLNSMLRKEKGKSLSLVDDIITLYDDKGFASKIIENQDLLESYRIIERRGRKNVPISERPISLVLTVKAIIGALFYEFDGNSTAVKNFIIRQFGI